MKKVGIVSLYNEKNFGNRLQSYALQKTLEKMGFTCESLVFRKPKTTSDSVITKVLKIARILLHRDQEYMRVARFVRFSSKNIRIRYINPKEPLNRIAQEYDFFVVGSDQVWNPCFGDFDELYDIMFLRFVPESKKVCYAPSFGVSDIPDEWKERFVLGLNDFQKISVRETAGQMIVKELTGKEACCVADPTLLLTEEEWQSISSNLDIKQKYVLCYFLGKNTADLQALGLDDNMLVIDIMDRCSGNYYRYGPADFLSLIYHAEYVCTDSFHACVFSILFDKTFYIYSREDRLKDMSSRMKSLLEMFDIQLSDSGVQKIHIDQEKRDLVLSRIRHEAYEFLDEQMCKK